MNRTEELRERGIPDRSRPEEWTEGQAREVLAHTIGADPFDKLEELRKAGKRKARAEGVFEQMKHSRKIILSRIASEMAQVHKNTSEAKLDRMARADPRYEKHIDGLAAATEERELALSEYFRIKAELDWMDKTVSHMNALARLER